MRVCAIDVGTNTVNALVADVRDGGLHVLADEELTFPFKAFQRFRDLEGVESMLRIDPQAIRAAYLEKVRDFVKSMEAASGKLQADYVPVNTKTPLRDTLLRYLGRRMNAKR